jgi:hypothetical protein
MAENGGDSLPRESDRASHDRAALFCLFDKLQTLAAEAHSFSDRRAHPLRARLKHLEEKSLKAKLDRFGARRLSLREESPEGG